MRAAATRAVGLTVRNNLNHPSVFAWSLANEPAGSRSELGAFGPGLERYIGEGAAAARELDDTRLIAIDRQSRVGEPLYSPPTAHLDVLGVNEYFGWYDSYSADLRAAPTHDELGPYLDELHAANPRLPLMITEYGAEASGRARSTSAGSYEFQTSFMSTTCASTPPSPTWPARSTGRCATSASIRPGTAARRPTSRRPPGTTRA